jgi:hypothetical protein
MVNDFAWLKAPSFCPAPAPAPTPQPGAKGVFGSGGGVQYDSSSNPYQVINRDFMCIMPIVNHLTQLIIIIIVIMHHHYNPSCPPHQLPGTEFSLARASAPVPAPSPSPAPAPAPQRAKPKLERAGTGGGGMTAGTGLSIPATQLDM